MQLPKSIIASIIFAIGFQQALAAPAAVPEDADLVVRATGTGFSKNDPVKAELTVKDQSALAFDADCYAILCKGLGTVFQRTNEDEKNRRENGASKKPFKDTKKWGTKVPPKNTAWSTQDFDSPEEYPFASTLQGGYGAILMPVNLAAQTSQGGVLNGFYRTNKIDAYDSNKQGNQRTWYQITAFAGSLGPYCKALNNNDKSVCSAGKKVAGAWGFDPADYAYKWDGKYFNKQNK